MDYDDLALIIEQSEKRTRFYNVRYRMNEIIDMIENYTNAILAGNYEDKTMILLMRAIYYMRNCKHPLEFI